MGYIAAGVGYVDADFAASTSDTEWDTGLMSVSEWAPVVGGGLEWMAWQNVSIGVNFNYFFLDKERELGSFGDGHTTGSAINFKGLATVDLSLKYRFN